mgnify:CR=1 FL=1
MRTRVRGRLAHSATLRLIHLVTDRLARTLDFDDALAALLEGATDLLGVERGSILILDAEKGTLSIRSAMGLSEAVAAAGGPADITVVCVDVPGCEQPAILSTAQGGTIIYFSMATSFSAAALGAEGLAADVRMLVGNGFAPGHAELALELVRSNGAVRALFEGRLAE